MERNEEIELIEHCLELARAKRPPSEGHEASIPVARYLDPSRFAQELEHLFRGGPVLAAHVSELATPGDFVTREIAGIPVLLVRSDEGMSAFLNVCRHRGAIVEPREHGRCKRFVCPYHAWTYDRHGTLVHLRHREGFPSVVPGELSLRRLPCLEAAGFVWVVADPSAAVELDAFLPPALVDELRGLEAEQLEVFASERRVWRANWKLLVDGGLEAYHFKIAHRDTIASLFLDTIAPYQPFGACSRMVLPRSSILELAERPREQWRLRDHANILYGLFPSATLLVQSDHVVLVSIMPLDLGSSMVELHTLAPKGARGGSREGYWRKNHALTITTLAEDFALGEQIQRGLASGANECFRLGRFEAAIERLHATIDARIGMPGG
ncbi:MAG: Rieske 2Fe-2S domain-containing protein [Myxococcales bacterium]|nr:Rieske 2Fe-2S domain-containing protein [Myxococcales bacterium]